MLYINRPELVATPRWEHVVKILGIFLPSEVLQRRKACHQEISPNDDIFCPICPVCEEDCPEHAEVTCVTQFDDNEIVPLFLASEIIDCFFFLCINIILFIYLFIFQIHYL